LITLLKRHFGEHNVVNVSNYNTFQLKSLVKDLARFYGLPYQDVNSILSTLDEEVRSKVLKQGDDKNLFELKLQDCMEHSSGFKALMDEHPEILMPLKVLLHENRSLGKHASGVIVSDDLPMSMPLTLSKKEFQTPWVEGMHHKHLNEFGYIKFDILGLETLRIIQRCIELIIQRHAGKKLVLHTTKGDKVTAYEQQWIQLKNSTWKKIIDIDDEDIKEPISISWVQR